MSTLPSPEVDRQLVSLPEWRIENGELTRTFGFANFRSAMRFVGRVADAADQADHHPDIDIRYNKVRLGLVTHSAGGLTEKDFALAAVADKLG